MDFVKFEQWVYKEFNINLSAYKSNQLHRRLQSFMQRIGAEDIDDFIEILKKDKIQRQKFLDFITINVSEFFRNPEIFEELKKRIQSELLPRNKKLRIWSAACSIGAEPYSIAILMDLLGAADKYQMVATDIDTTILEKAKKGIFTAAEVKNVTPQNLKKYFTQEEDKYRIDDSLKSNISFKKHDLILEPYEKNFDLIICRNVVIYFNQDVKNSIYNKFSESLAPEGLLFVGATESIYNYRDYGFEKASTFIYRKL